MFFPFAVVLTTTVKRKVWFYKRGNFEKLNDKILNTNWDFINTISMNDACIQFTDAILKYMDECIPSKDVTIRPNDKPWYNSEIRLYSRKRDRQRTKAGRTQSIDDWTKYRHFRNKVNNLKKYAKEQYFSNMEDLIVDSSKTNPKLYWKLLKQLIKTNKNCETIPPLKVTLDNGENKHIF